MNVQNQYTDVTNGFNNQSTSAINSDHSLQGAGNESSNQNKVEIPGIKSDGTPVEIMDLGTIGEAASATANYSSIIDELNQFVDIMKTPVDAYSSLLSEEIYATAGLTEEIISSLGSDPEIKSKIEESTKKLKEIEEELNKLKKIKNDINSGGYNEFKEIYKYININNVERSRISIIQEFMNVTENDPALFKEIIGITREQYQKIDQTIGYLETIVRTQNQEILQQKCRLILNDYRFENFECTEEDYTKLKDQYKEITDEIFSVMTEEEKKLLAYIEKSENISMLEKAYNYYAYRGLPQTSIYIENMMDLWNQRAAEKRTQKRIEDLVNEANGITINEIIGRLGTTGNDKYKYLEDKGQLGYTPDDYQKFYEDIIREIYYSENAYNTYDVEKIDIIRQSIPTPEEYANDYCKTIEILYNEKITEKFKEYKDEEITQDNYGNKVLELMNIFNINDTDILYSLEESTKYAFLINELGFSFSLQGVSPEQYKAQYENIKERTRIKLQNKGIIDDGASLLPTPEEYANDFYKAAVQKLYEKKFYENENFSSIMKVYGVGIKDGIITWGEGIYNAFYADGLISIEQYERMLYANYLAEKFQNLDTIYNIGSATGNMLPTITISLLLSHGLGMFTSMSANAATSIANVASQSIMGLTTFGNTFDQTLSEGYSRDIATLYSFSIAGSEVLMEKFLGGILGLGDNVTKNIVAEMFQEGCEETITTLLQDGVLNQLILGKKIDLNEYFNKFGEDFLVSMLVAGSLNTYTNTLSNFIVNGRLYTLTPKQQEAALEYKATHNVSLFEAIASITTPTPDSLESTNIASTQNEDKSVDNTIEEETFEENYAETEQTEETIETYSSIDNTNPDIEEIDNTQEEHEVTTNVDISEETSTNSETLEDSTSTTIPIEDAHIIQPTITNKLETDAPSETQATNTHNIETAEEIQYQVDSTSAPDSLESTTITPPNTESSLGKPIEGEQTEETKDLSENLYQKIFSLELENKTLEKISDIEANIIMNIESIVEEFKLMGITINESQYSAFINIIKSQSRENKRKNYKNIEDYIDNVKKAINKNIYLLFSYDMNMRDLKGILSPEEKENIDNFFEDMLNSKNITEQKEKIINFYENTKKISELKKIFKKTKVQLIKYDCCGIDILELLKENITIDLLAKDKLEFKKIINNKIIEKLPRNVEEMDSVITTILSQFTRDGFLESISVTDKLLMYDFLYDNSNTGQNLETLKSGDKVGYEMQKYLLEKKETSFENIKNKLNELYENTSEYNDCIYSLIEEYNSIDGKNFLYDCVLNEDFSNFNNVYNHILDNRKKTLTKIFNKILNGQEIDKIGLSKDKYEELLKKNIYTESTYTEQYVYKYILENLINSVTDANIINNLETMLKKYNRAGTLNNANNSINLLEEYLQFQYDKVLSVEKLLNQYVKNPDITSLVSYMLNNIQEIKKRKITRVANYTLGYNNNVNIDNIVNLIGPHTSDKRISELVIEEVLKSTGANISVSTAIIINTQLLETLGIDFEALTVSDINQCIENTNAKTGITFSALLNLSIEKMLADEKAAYNESLLGTKEQQDTALENLRKAQAEICKKIAEQLTNNYNNAHKGNEISESFLASVIPHILMYDEAKGQIGGGHYQSPLLYPYKLDDNQNIMKYKNSEGNIGYYEFKDKDGNLMNKTFWPSNYSFQEIIDTLMYFYTEKYDKELSKNQKDRYSFEIPYIVIQEDGTSSNDSVIFVIKKSSYADNNFTESVVTFYPQGNNSTASTNQTTNP